MKSEEKREEEARRRKKKNKEKERRRKIRLIKISRAINCLKGKPMESPQKDAYIQEEEGE